MRACMGIGRWIAGLSAQDWGIDGGPREGCRRCDERAIKAWQLLCNLISRRIILRGLSLLCWS